ncbi:uncharacterized protein LOC111110981 [Crassostrea virginica]|uniref:Uncharacterized protein LOC111110981 n=1 Tax=Crassostrea virginica TaxID=6565 RepID=A0A8B8BKL1_CRAVI|nr:uncharacterized protein LOC111110981 [Crassostrea virginica]XP_022329217.1 uncharacterized protein LOC111128083 [Crassostrea virginica]|mmetsp:Transcript_1971/g.3480  ORF Transcript_1971/g.3480 Transcript_1971/m.3480 type:complete len:146 (+) Transcript_1971:85-522(+)
MISTKMNLFFLLGAVFCLYLALPQTEAVSMHCGYHIVGHYVTTLYNSTHYTRYFRVMYGICNSQGNLERDLYVYYDGLPLYYKITYTRNMKREAFKEESLGGLEGDVAEEKKEENFLGFRGLNQSNRKVVKDLSEVKKVLFEKKN